MHAEIRTNLRQVSSPPRYISPYESLPCDSQLPCNTKSVTQPKPAPASARFRGAAACRGAARRHAPRPTTITALGADQNGEREGGGPLQLRDPREGCEHRGGASRTPAS